jgi:hypothetical protein
MVKLIPKLILVLLALKFMHQHFEGYLMLMTSLNCLRVLIIPETSLGPFVALELVLVAIVLLVNCQFVIDLFALDLLLILELLHSIMLLMQSFKQLLPKNQLEFSYLRWVIEDFKLLFIKFF